MRFLVTLAFLCPVITYKILYWWVSFSSFSITSKCFWEDSSNDSWIKFRNLFDTSLMEINEMTYFVVSEKVEIFVHISKSDHVKLTKLTNHLVLHCKGSPQLWGGFTYRTDRFPLTEVDITLWTSLKFAMQCSPYIILYLCIF